MPTKNPARTLPDWAQILSRTAAALVGGYLFSYTLTAALARLLPLEPVDAAIVSSLPVFAVYTFAILWAFAACSLRRAWLLGGVAAPLAIAGFWPQLVQRLS